MTYLVRKGNKYNAKSTIYNEISYHSKFEAGYAQELDLRKKAGDIKDWERQVKVSLDIINSKTGVKYHICNYYVDFKVYHNDESEELVEVKGFETEIFRLKRKLLEALILESNPDLKYTIIK